MNGLIAILRGVLPDDVLAVGEILLEHGIRIIEVLLNSPRPLESIELLAWRFGPEAEYRCGARASCRALNGGKTLMVQSDTFGSPEKCDCPRSFDCV